MAAVARKAEKKTGALVKLMPRVGGAGETARRLLGAVGESIILYAAGIWIDSMEIKKYRDNLTRAQRKLALRASRAYRTVSTPRRQHRF